MIDRAAQFIEQGAVMLRYGINEIGKRQGRICSGLQQTVEVGSEHRAIKNPLVLLESISKCLSLNV